MMHYEEISLSPPPPLLPTFTSPLLTIYFADLVRRLYLGVNPLNFRINLLNFWINLLNFRIYPLNFKHFFYCKLWLKPCMWILLIAAIDRLLDHLSFFFSKSLIKALETRMRLYKIKLLLCENRWYSVVQKFVWMFIYLSLIKNNKMNNFFFE